MANEWIKMRASLTNCPRVAAMARSLGAGEVFAGVPRGVVRLVVVGGLHSVWSAVNEHTRDGVMTNATLATVDDISGVDGFGAAMLGAGWLEFDEAGSTVTFPNFDQWNTPAKDTTAAERMRKHREKQRVTRNTVTVTRNAPVTVTIDKTRQDKSIQNPTGSVATTDPPKRRKRSPPPDAIAWSADAGWQGIEDADREAWRLAYPACDLAVELARATEWLRANPAKARKSSWRRFLVAWLTRSQDRGGSSRQPNGQPAGKPPVDPARRSWFRGDAGASMTDAQYAAWRASRSAGGERRPPAGPTTLGAVLGLDFNGEAAE